MSTKTVNEISERLERARQHMGFKTLREFHAALVADEAYSVSYEAVRNYHYDRTPPIDYLVRVADVTGYSLEWLATGRGHWMEKERFRLAAEREGRDDRVQALDELREGADKVCWEIWAVAFPEQVHSAPVRALHAAFIPLAVLSFIASRGVHIGPFTAERYQEFRDYAWDLYFQIEAPFRHVTELLQSAGAEVDRPPDFTLMGMTTVASMLSVGFYRDFYRCIVTEEEVSPPQAEEE